MATGEGFQTLPLKLLIDKVEYRVLYAESDKRFVDLVFWFLRLPAASIVELLSTLTDSAATELGSLGNVYKSVKNLQPELWLSGDCKAELMQPKLKSFIKAPPKEALLKIEASPKSPRRGEWMDTPDSSSKSSSSSSLSGYVKETVTFMITDDLQVAPASTIASITLLNKLNLTNLSHLEERNVSVGFNEAVELLKAMLISKTPLNDVFGGKEKLSRETT